MDFSSGRADGQACLISEGKRLILIEGGAQDILVFAVMSGTYLAANSPYLKPRRNSKDITLTVDINGENNPQQFNYDIFEKTRVTLPNTCIEAAEHAMKCMFRNSNSVVPIRDGTVAEISMEITRGEKFDIDKVDMNIKSSETFKNDLLAPDATNQTFEPGEGMALVFSKPESTRKEGDWKVHAVAILLRDGGHGFMVVEEQFAPDVGGEPKMANSWKLAAYDNAADFASTYKMVAPKYKLWKLTASEI